MARVNVCVGVLFCVAACGEGGFDDTGQPCEREHREFPAIHIEDWDEGVIGRTPPNCRFVAGSTVSESVGPTAAQMISPNLKHVVVLLRENRSFDHMLGAVVAQDLPLRPDAEVTNPDPAGLQRDAVVARFHEQHYCTANPAHEWSDVHLQYNNGELDGFVSASNRSGSNHGGCVAMGYYTREDLQLYAWLADNFAVSQNYHASLLGPTMPNISFYFYASSCGTTENMEAVSPLTGCSRTSKSIFQLLDNHASYAVYSDSSPTALSAAVGLAKVNPLAIRSIARLEQDLANNQLPDVVFVEPNYGHGFGVQNDEHPPTNIQEGQAFTFRIVNAIMSSPAWQSTVLFISWDEHGGYYDHVQPPDACAPDDNKPRDFAFDRLGFRTPFFAISPFARKGYVSRYTADHSSILRFIEAWKGLGALTKRDANAWPLLDMFDFTTTRSDVSPPDPQLAAKSSDPLHIAPCADLDHVSSSCEQ